MKRLVYTALVFLLPILLSGCVKRELDLPEGKFIHIQFDWSHLNDTPNMPTEMVIRFYSSEGEFLFERTCNTNGFDGYVPDGKYKILIYNPGVKGIGYEDMNSFKNAHITVPTQSEEGEVLETPSNIYGTGIKDMVVSGEETDDIKETIKPYLHSVMVRVRVTGNSEDVAECSATIKGVAEAVNLSTGLAMSGTNSPIFGHLYRFKDTYQGLFRLTGNDEQYPSVISIKVRFKDGTEKTIQHNFSDFMDQIDQHSSDVPLLIELSIDVQLIDGIYTATLKDWVYKEGEIVLD